MRSAVWLVVVAAGLVLSPGPAAADGTITVRIEDLGERTTAQAVADGLLSSDGQRALYARAEGGAWDLFVEPGSFTTPEAAWVLPLPVAPDEIAEASEGFLTQLEAATRPLLVETVQYSVEYCEPPPGYAMCGGSGSDGGSGPAPDGALAETIVPAADEAIEALGEGRVGPLDWQVLSAEDPGALEEWLGTNGYAVPDGLAERAAPYVEQGWFFLVARLARGADDPTGVLTLRLRLPLPATTVPVYPLRLTTLSMGDALNLTVWVADDVPRVPLWERSRVAIYPTSYSYEGLEGAPPDFAEQYHEALLEALGNSRLVYQFGQPLALEDVLRRAAAPTAGGENDPLGPDPAAWAPELQALIERGPWVTRWRGRIHADRMDEDLRFFAEGAAYALATGIHTRTIYRTLTPKEAGRLDVELGPSDGSSRYHGAALLLVVVLGGRVLRRRGRREPGPVSSPPAR